MNVSSNASGGAPYADNAGFMADLRRFYDALLVYAELELASSPATAIDDPSVVWRTIAARMAATVRAEIFIPLAHVALVFHLDARDLQLLALALLVETDPSITGALAALTEAVSNADQFDERGDNARAVTGPPRDVSLKTATHLLGDVRASLFPDRPLLYNQLIELVDVNISALTGSYRLTRVLTPYLLGLAAPQPRIGDHLLDDVFVDEDLDELITYANVKQQLLRFSDICSASGERFGAVVLHIEAEDPTLAAALAATAFSTLGYGLTKLDARHLRSTYQNDNQRLGPLLQQLRLACRDAALCTQVIVLTDTDALASNEERDQTDIFDSVLASMLDSTPYFVIVNGSMRRVADIAFRQRQRGARVFQLRVPALKPDLRKQAWDRHAHHYGLSIDDRLMTAVAGAYAFTEARIAAVAGVLAGHYALSGYDAIEPLVWDACRVEAEAHPIGVAKRVETPYRLADLVAPDSTTELLRETLGQMRYRSKVLDEWGFAAKSSNAANLCVLFHGPPGTGKTMASSIIANELSLPLYRVDLSTVLSKYIGETERNIAQLFDRAEQMNVVLLFDEAEGLFGKRTESKDSHDRFANLQVGFLLQRIELYPGLVILSTNLMSNLDKAFLRRFRFVIEFPFPTSDERLRLWRQIFPEEVRLDADVDLGLLAEKASLSGGHIRNAAISAAFLAAHDAGSVNMSHLVKSVRREYEKLGKLFSEADFHGARAHYLSR